jgi:hypothetical protein
MHEACPVSVHEDRPCDHDTATSMRASCSDQVHEHLGCDHVWDAGHDQVIGVAEVAEVRAYPRPASAARAATSTGSAVAAAAEPICPKRGRARRQRNGTRDREPRPTRRPLALHLDCHRPSGYGRRDYVPPPVCRGADRVGASRLRARTAAASGQEDCHQDGDSTRNPDSGGETLDAHCDDVRRPTASASHLTETRLEQPRLRVSPCEPSYRVQSPPPSPTGRCLLSVIPLPRTCASGLRAARPSPAPPGRDRRSPDTRGFRRPSGRVSPALRA